MTSESITNIQKQLEIAEFIRKLLSENYIGQKDIENSTKVIKEYFQKVIDGIQTIPEISVRQDSEDPTMFWIKLPYTVKVIEEIELELEQDKPYVLGSCERKGCRGFIKHVNLDYCRRCKKLIEEHEAKARKASYINNLVAERKGNT